MQVYFCIEVIFPHAELLLKDIFESKYLSESFKAIHYYQSYNTLTSFVSLIQINRKAAAKGYSFRLHAVDSGSIPVDIKYFIS